MSQSKVIALLESAKLSVRTQLNKSRAQELRVDLTNLPDLDPVQNAIQEAQILEQAILNLCIAKRNVAQSILAGLWEVYLSQMFQLMGEYNDFNEWIRTTLDGYEDTKYIGEMALIVTRVLQDVHQKEIANKHYILEDGTKVTVDYLLQRQGLIYKFKTISKVYSEETEDDSRGEILETVVTGTRQDVETIRDTKSGKITIIIPYRTKITQKGTIIETEPLTDEQVATLMTLLGDAGQMSA